VSCESLVGGGATTILWLAGSVAVVAVLAAMSTDREQWRGLGPVNWAAYAFSFAFGAAALLYLAPEPERCSSRIHAVILICAPAIVLGISTTTVMYFARYRRSDDRGN
jgi:hypothetical protein